MQSKKLQSDFSNYVQSITVSAIDVEARKQFESSFALLELKKNQFLVKEGQICPYFCYLESGILQHSINVDEQEKTTYLALRNTFTSSLFSFLFQTPSRKSIKAIFDCKLWVLDLKTFQELKEKNEVFRQFYYNLIEKQICLIDDYRIDLLTLTPEERYNKLILTEPHLIKQVPLHYLASFLGISSRHMSRIRKNIN
ncbi:MAG: Crp/Fnr family transcriptional regulator [Flavobacterium sp.]|nr:Crp/Fnr family transcriptional regulator [Flavobacterium sp.]